MFLKRVEVRSLRNLTSVSLTPTSGLNILEGRNASGKTSFLEALYLLALARSFRTTKVSQLIQDGKTDLVLFAEITNGSSHRIGVQRYSDNRMVIRVDGQTLPGRTQLVQLVPLQLITPDSISLLTGSPLERRQYLDWIMFHVEPSFHSIWSSYQRYLKQRNALLREQRLDQLEYWTAGLAECGEQISRLRKSTLDALLPLIQNYLSMLLPDYEIALSYRSGWKSGTSLATSLANGLDTDLKQKFTGSGPHRGDLAITTEQNRVADVLSRGQLKLLLCALKLAQLDYIKQKTGKTAIVLIDDLPAELDKGHRALLLSLMHDLNNQVFVTSTDRSHLDYSSWEDVKVFHVEHGDIKEVV